MSEAEERASLISHLKTDANNLLGLVHPNINHVLIAEFPGEERIKTIARHLEMAAYMLSNTASDSPEA